MAGKKTAKATKRRKEPADSNIKAAILDSVDALFTEHADEIRVVREESAGKAIKVNYGVDIDCSESAPKVTVQISFASKVTDRRSLQLDDPNQGTFEEIVKPAEAETKKKRGKKDPEQPELQPSAGGEIGE